MLGIFKLRFRYFIASTLFLSILVFSSTTAISSSYKIHNCEACNYQYRIDAEAVYVRCPSCSYESSLDDADQHESTDLNQKPLSTNKQLKKSLKEAKNELIVEAIDSLSKAIVGGPANTSNQPSEMSHHRTQPVSSKNFGAGVVQSGNGRSGKNISNDMECSKCGYSAAFFPYADSSKKKLRCPSCGERKSLR